MSVINQMLKELDKRQQPVNNGAGVVPPVPSTHASRVGWLLLIILLLVAVIGYLLWQQLTTSKTSIEPFSTQLSVVEQKEDKKAVIVSEALPSSVDSTDAAVAKQSTFNEQSTSQTSLVSRNLTAADADKIQLSQQPKQTETLVVQQVPPTLSEQTTNNEITQNNNQEIQAQSAALTQASQSGSSDAVATKPVKTQQPKAEQEPPQLVIKQTQVSPEQLVAKKMASAEQALRQNDVQLAEQYLADVLLLQPTHIDARKQLAALWFGRKAYQEAINTLSQGIALAPHNSELRLLQSRIYLQQGYTELALQALSALTVDEVTNIEYLATLANIAQQLQRWPLALNGYQRLTQLQPTQANWWLGLAIAQDSEGQFQQAIESYNNALFQGNLSPDAKQFIQQRLAEIGE